MPMPKPLELKCIDGRCPPNIDMVKEIALTPLEKKAIFFCLKNSIETLKERLREEIPD